jgi:Rnl2 family RNA ligase
MTSFVKYNSIENHYRDNAVQAFAAAVPEDEDCIFTEKVHGANLQVYVSDDGIRIARRGDFLGANENFNGANEIIEAQREKFEEALLIVRKYNYKEEVVEISVCGEIFGGDYPGIKSTTKSVQKGVFYSPARHFYAFDIRLFYANTKYTEEKPAPYAEWTNFCKVMDTAEIFRAQELGRLTSADVFAQLKEHKTIPSLPPKFASTIPSQLGFPHLEDNWAEGYVIRPSKSYFSHNGTRYILKYKNPTFAEAVSAPKKAVKVKDDVLDAQWTVVEAEFFEPTVIKNRLDNVLSKESYGLSDNKKRGAIIKALTADVMQDLVKAHEGFDEKKLGNQVNGACAKFIHECITATK